jgi:hypothetical protein
MYFQTGFLTHAITMFGFVHSWITGLSSGYSGPKCLAEGNCKCLVHDFTSAWNDVVNNDGEGTSDDKSQVV